MKGVKKFFFILFGVIAALILGAAAFWFSVTANVRLDPQKLSSVTSCVRICDADGEELQTPQTRERLSALPAHLPAAFVAVEDKRFYSHRGLDLRRIAKATMKNIFSLSFREGASTISQQLIKNTHLSGEKTLTRKLRELKLARELEKRYTKDQILECYLNSIYFGHSAFGIGDAAHFYFGKGAADLSVAESATVAALVRSPNRYSPFKDKEKCLSRRNFVLRLMLEQGAITKKEYDEALAEQLPSAPAEQGTSAYLSLVYEELAERFPDAASGEELRVHTFLNGKLQAELERAECDSDVCLLVRENETGGICALHSTCGILKRLPASTIKPLAVYAPALQEGLISPVTPVLDEKVNFAGYSPSNYDGKYGGYMSARYALAHSVNVPAVKLLNAVGCERASEYLEKMGLRVPVKDLSLALALGGISEGFSLPALADAYSVFANAGLYSPSATIRRVENGAGKTLYSRPENRDRVFSEDVCAIVNDMLETAVKEGTAKKLNVLPFPVCAKTGTGGTEQGNTDAYTIAYTSEYTAAVWMGNRDNSPVKTTGGGLPANETLRILKTLYKNRTPAPFFETEDVISLGIDREEYEKNHRVLLADPAAPDYLSLHELFRKSCIPEGKSERFSHPTIAMPQISVKNSSVCIVLCQTQYYDYEIIRENEDEKKTIYSGKYREIVYDNSVQEGKRYTYTVTPSFCGKRGESVTLPSVYIQPQEKMPEDWWEDSLPPADQKTIRSRVSHACAVSSSLFSFRSSSSMKESLGLIAGCSGKKTVQQSS